jgi:hypothetical protein
VPDCHESAVFGAVTVIAGATIEKATLLTSVAGVSIEVTRTIADAVAGPVTVHANVPDAAAVFWTDGAIVSQAPPPLRDTSILIAETVPRLWLHVIDCTDPTAHVTGVFGAVTVTVGVAVAI